MHITNYLKAALKYGASDILITAYSPPVFRVDGDIQQVKEPPLTPEQTKELLYSILTPTQIEQFEKQKELDLGYELDNENRFRVNVYFQRGSVSAAFRPISNQIPSLNDLGVPSIMADIALKSQGLVIITGPTGHGKSTTQAAMIDFVNERRKAHIITIEDPIEFTHVNKKSIVDQREIGRDSHTFPTALKYVLRQDPDVILVGEMRDLETISTCLTAAETGHLVISTLHTNDAIQSVDRLVDVFPPHQQKQIRLQVSMALLAILAQRLIPRARGQGRVLATELLVNNSAVSNLIREAKTPQIKTVIESQRKLGMHSMDSSIKELYSDGVISYESASALVSSPDILK